MTRTNRRFSPHEKVRILKRHLAEGEPISAICQDEQIAPTQFYAWQKTFFENGAAAFQKENAKAQQAQLVHVSKLEGTLQRKDYVIAKLTEENLTLKKDLGEI